MNLIDVQVKVLEKMRENHEAVMNDWKVSHDVALESTMSDYMSAMDIVNEVFNELIEEQWVI